MIVSIPTHQRTLTASLALACVAILQYHSILFWWEKAELGLAGLFWSVILEGCALWLWWQRKRSMMVLALVGSSLLLAGPLVQVGFPLFQAVAANEITEKVDFSRVELLKRSIESLESSLKSYEANASSRIGWAGRIDDTRNALQQQRDALMEAYKAPVQVEIPALKLAVIGGQALALLIYQLTAVLAVLKLSKWQEVINTPVAVNDDDNVNRDEVAEALGRFMETTGLEGKALADRLNESSTTLWRVATRKDNVGKDTLERVMGKVKSA